MLVACRLAGLSSLEAHYAGVADARNAGPPHDMIGVEQPVLAAAQNALAGIRSSRISQDRALRSLQQRLPPSVAAYFARQQWRTAQRQAETAIDQLRFNLFEKRYAIYEEVKRLIALTLNDAFNPEFDLAGC
jgi:hypothetical protein